VHGGVVVELCTHRRKESHESLEISPNLAAFCWPASLATHRERPRRGSSCPWTSCPR
jgi:hypothetical protein